MVSKLRVVVVVVVSFPIFETMKWVYYYHY